MPMTTWCNQCNGGAGYHDAGCPKSAICKHQIDTNFEPCTACDDEYTERLERALRSVFNMLHPLAHNERGLKTDGKLGICLDLIKRALREDGAD